jgi:23S rRNA (pseudouridine1915-N3)-methyltransferase
VPDIYLITKVGPIIMKIAFLQVGKTSEKYLTEGIRIFEARLKKYSPFEILTVPELRNKRNMPVAEQKIREGERIGKIIRDDDYVVFLDEKGKQLSTIEFASWFERCLMLPEKRILFVSGGPWGFSDEIIKQSNVCLSLSMLTFSHQIVRLIFLEQLYRVFTIIRSEPYHHE